MYPLDAQRVRKLRGLDPRGFVHLVPSVVMAFPKGSRAVYMQQRVVTNMESVNQPYGRTDFDPFLPLMLLCSMDHKEENA